MVLNVLASPGAGKTAFIERTAADLGTRLRLGVIVGDLATDNDAVRLRGHGIPAIQITTGSVCHLDAEMVARAMERLDLNALDVLVIENVGNLVCPAVYDLGESARVVLLSVTEGEDKPLKYPVMFQSAQVVVVNKMDLAAAVGFDRETALRQHPPRRARGDHLRGLRQDGPRDGGVVRLPPRPSGADRPLGSDLRLHRSDPLQQTLHRAGFVVVVLLPPFTQCMAPQTNLQSPLDPVSGRRRLAFHSDNRIDLRSILRVRNPPRTPCGVGELSVRPLPSGQPRNHFEVYDLCDRSRVVTIQGGG